MNKCVKTGAAALIVACLLPQAFAAKKDKPPKPKLTADKAVEYKFKNVSVHDPSIFKGEDGAYYIFGSHLAAAKTEDLMNWESINNAVRNNNPIVPDVFTEMKEAFDWSKSKTFWAPDVIQLSDGKFHWYYSNCKGDSPRSCIGTAVSDKAGGPYKNEGIMMRSGQMTTIEEKPLREEDKNYNATVDPNAVDPCVFFDTEGRLWMVYGSYSGGIFIKEMDPDTGLQLEKGYGKKLLGANHLRIEAPYIIYSPDSGYYYLFLSFGGLGADGGYNVRVARSKTPDGPYLDSMGQDMINCKGPSGGFFDDATASLYGTKLMGGYKFVWEKGEMGKNRKGYLSPGHNSCLYQEETGKYFIIYHTRFENSGEGHEIRVHQMFINAEGWPVIAPYRYVGESAKKVTADEIVGTYKVINHGRDIPQPAGPHMHESVSATLFADGTYKGKSKKDSGTWKLSGDNTCEITIGDATYSGVFVPQWDEDGQKYVMTFTAVNAKTGVAIWGSGLNARKEL